MTAIAPIAPEALHGRSWLQTHKGRAWLPESPETFDYDVEEIAHALSNLCRYFGHVRHFYNVAHHSVLVANHVWDVAPAEILLDERRKLARAALLHDAAEAFCGDMVAPLKRLPEMAGYRALIERVEMAIAVHFDLVVFLDAQPIRQADMVVLATEKRDLRDPSIYDGCWGPLPSPLPQRIIPMSPELSARIFLDNWKAYGGSL